MKLLHYGKDGGEDSNVSGYWLIEWKKLFSVVLLKFSNGTRDVYHDHAFNCISWVLKGSLIESNLDGSVNVYKRSIFPIITKKNTFHQVESVGTTWVFSIRGPWKKTWNEFLPDQFKFVKLTSGRKVVND